MVQRAYRCSDGIDLAIVLRGSDLEGVDRISWCQGRVEQSLYEREVRSV